MTTVDVATASARMDLGETAAVVRQATDMDRIVICGCAPDGTLTVLGEDGDRAVGAAYDVSTAHRDSTSAGHHCELPAVVRRSLGDVIALSTSMVVDDHPVGMLHAFTRRGEPAPGTERLLAFFARQAAFAMEHRRTQDHSEVQSADAKAVAALDELVLTASDYREFVRRLTAVLGPVVSAELVAVAVVDEQRGVLQMLPGSYGASPEVAASCQIDTRDSRSSSARVLLMRQPWMTEHADREGALREFVKAFGLTRVMTIPLVVGGRGIGILNLANKPSPFTAADVSKITLLAPRVASAVENVRLLLKIRRREALEAILGDLAVAVAYEGSPRAQLVSALQRYAEVTETDLAVVSTQTAEPNLVRRSEVPAHLEEQFLRQAREGGRSVRSAVAAPRAAGDPGSASLHVPILVSEQRVAAISVFRQGGGPFASDESAALSRFADLAALGWTTQRYQRQRAAAARLVERQRIAADLHDRVAQLLFSGQLALDSALERQGLGRETRADITRARTLITRGQTAIGEVIDELSEPQRADLKTRLAVLGEELEAEHGLAINIDVAADVSAARPIRKAITDLFIRTAAEAVTNTAKHAHGATRTALSVRITRDHRLLLTAVDNGEGPSGETKGSHHGLTSLRHAFRMHGGTVRVSRDRGGGTRLTASVPL